MTVEEINFEKQLYELSRKQKLPMSVVLTIT